MIWGRRRGVEVGLCDLPASMVLAPNADRPGMTMIPGSTEHRIYGRDPLGALAAAAGYDDAERWWDDVVESRLDGSSPFPMISEAMAELRMIASEYPDPIPLDHGDQEQSDQDRPDHDHRNQDEGDHDHHDQDHQYADQWWVGSSAEAHREAYMRLTIRAALKRGRERVAVVCGAWHAPALTWPLPPAAGDTRLLRGIPKRKVALTWVPWTHQRLARDSGYGAGVASPGWYHHLWTAPDRPVVRWLTRVAHTLRGHDLPVSSAQVIEAVRLAETLASLRERPLAGLAEVTEATGAVLADGDSTAIDFITRELVVGVALGSVSDAVPMVPLEADLVKTCRMLRLRREVRLRWHDLDLRKPGDQQRSRLFHRLQLLDLEWIRPARSAVDSRGTFRESWQSRWQPEYSHALVEAAVWGTIVGSAAAARIDHLVGGGTLAELTRAVERCLLADLPGARDRLLRALSSRAALDVDVTHLMDAMPALARAQRYGDVRQTDTSALRRVSEVLVTRICAGLSYAAAGLDEEAAAGMRTRIDEVSAAVGLLGPGPREAWFAALTTLAGRLDLHGLLMGRVVRLLSDAGRLDDGPIRVHRALSHGVSAAAKAAWVDGFFGDGALLLIHDAELRGLLDDWLCALNEDEFVDVLPLVRRTFGTFTAPERRIIAGRVAAGSGPPEHLDEEVDHTRASIALAGVEQILRRP